MPLHGTAPACCAAGIVGMGKSRCLNDTLITWYRNNARENILPTETLPPRAKIQPKTHNLSHEATARCVTRRRVGFSGVLELHCFASAHGDADCCISIRAFASSMIYALIWKRGSPRREAPALMLVLRSLYPDTKLDRAALIPAEDVA